MRQRRVEDLQEHLADAHINRRRTVFTQCLQRCFQDICRQRVAIGLHAVDHERLGTTLVQQADEADLSLGGARFFQLVQKRELDSTTLTQTCTLPPHARPTSQACSLVTPKSRSLGGAPFHDFQGLAHDRTLDAAAGDRAHHGAGVIDHQLAAGRTGGTAPGRHHRGQGNLAAGLLPGGGEVEELVVGVGGGRTRRGVDLLGEALVRHRGRGRR